MNEILNGVVNDDPIQRMHRILDNADAHVAKVIPITEKPRDRDPSQGAPRDRSGRMFTPAELVLFGDGMAEDQYNRIASAARIDAAGAYDRPPQLFTFDGHPLLTMQNISVIGGKAKSRKSGWASVLASMVINPNSNRDDWQRMRGSRLTAERPYQRSGVLFFDTEQSTYHVFAMMRRVLYMADRNPAKGESGSNPASPLHMFALRDFHPSERLQFIAATIERHADTCSLVIIDGIRDVVLNINSEEEATMMASWLLSVTKRHNIHLTCVLHENKGSDSLRGHIGTELMNKSEAVFTVTKGSTKATADLSAVETSVSRNKGMTRIGIESMEIEHDGIRMWIPALTDDGRADRIGKDSEGQTATDNSITRDQHVDILRAIWSDDLSKEYTAGDLRDAIAAHAGNVLGRMVSDREGKRILSEWHNVQKWITDNGKGTRGRAYRLAVQPWMPAPEPAKPATTERLRFDDFGGDDVPF
jgi:hypothetical protein